MMASAPTERTRSALRWGGVKEEQMGLADDQLLDRFLGPDESAAETAFQALVRRHGPMVMGVCRHILDQVHDAEDAFQATFLVLARKAGTIHDRRVLGRWLYEVAYRIAIRSRTHAARRRAHERQGAEMAAAEPRLEEDPGWTELRPVLHEEVNRLPEKYRTAVVLCYFEGRTNEEAAELLQWPVGTVKGRLSRAREMLRTRLNRRGLGLSSAFLAMSLARNETFAEMVSSRLVDVTAQNAMLATRLGGIGSGAISDRVVALANDAPTPSPSPWTISWANVSVLAVAILIAAAVVFGLTAGITEGGWTTSGLAIGSPFGSATGAPNHCH
jgi:RNA polymerase sigma factor (sigma-70 family)